MDNIYDFIMEKQMVYIFPEKYTENECDNELLLATAVVANLYYQYTLSFYIYVLFPLLKEGGVYLYEDCHSSYSPRYGGGYKKKGAFIEYSKNFVDYVISQFADLEKRDKLSLYADDIKACHYYDSMVVVEKKCRGYSFFTEFGEE